MIGSPARSCDGTGGLRSQARFTRPYFRARRRRYSYPNTPAITVPHSAQAAPFMLRETME